MISLKKVENSENQQIKQTNLITPQGYKILVDEFHELSKKERPLVVQEVSAAAKLGDRSENAEYQYGKKRLREIDRRLRFLDKRISAARIINPKEQQGNKILFGATVTLENTDGKKVVYQIVGEDEANLTLKKISWKSPLGQELLNKQKGEIAVVEAPAGIREYEIIDFKFV
ncbi:transcription elongation factor GreB [Silvanigrella aquatica]|uniref:Transcription elongation factor GreB n=1 Tax=Silvanigrella aquatica TaxID=1915309 RepID=A0A1L4CYJ4_9BACT|nr:transcription elongation factor GreB [Silvanigrella aquatica]APJ03022.1 transcription elongation factor GreB [Silvanigrella aquatica]